MLFVCASQKTYKKGMAEQAMGLSVYVHRKPAVAEEIFHSCFCASDEPKSVPARDFGDRWRCR